MAIVIDTVVPGRPSDLDACGCGVALGLPASKVLLAYKNEYKYNVAYQL